MTFGENRGIEPKSVWLFCPTLCPLSYPTPYSKRIHDDDDDDADDDVRLSVLRCRADILGTKENSLQT